MNLKSLLLLLLSLCTGCVYRSCCYIIKDIEFCETVSERKQVKVHGGFRWMKRSFIFDETRSLKDGEFLPALVTRLPVYLFMLPLQLMIYENKQDVPMDAIIDLGPGVWKDVHVYKVDKELYKVNEECHYSGCSEIDKKICDLTTPDGRKALLFVRYKDDDSYGVLFLRIDDKCVKTCEKQLFKWFSAPWNRGWLVVDDSGEVVYIRASSFSKATPFEGHKNDSTQQVAYRLMWQSGMLEPFIELAYGELVRGKEE